MFTYILLLLIMPVISFSSAVESIFSMDELNEMGIDLSYQTEFDTQQNCRC